MSGATSIGGGAVNGATGLAAFTFYVGPVGIRDRGDRLEVAFFATIAKSRIPTEPVEGLLDGQRVTVTDIRTRDLNPDDASRSRTSGPRAIIATVIPSPAS